MAFADRAQFGAIIFPTDYTIDPVELARELEGRGFDLLLFPEHTHIPASRKTPFPIGGDLPQCYWSTHDPFLALAACASATERIRLGTGICLVPQHHPITLAKKAASLDALSSGRFLLGVGAGWNREEMENHGVAYDKRWKILRESVLAMREIWTKEEAEFHGEFVDFDPVWSHPKPVQSGGPPVLIGASSNWTYDRIAEYADGWLPFAGADALDIARLRGCCEERGRSLDEIEILQFGAPVELEPNRRSIEAGADGLIYWLPDADRDTVLPMLDDITKHVEQLKAG